MNPLDALHLQLRLEGRALIGDDSLRQVEVVHDEEMPLMLIAQLAGQNLVAYFDESLEQGLQAELKKQVSRIAFPNMDALSALLNQRNISFEVGQYKTNTFPEAYAAFKDETVHCYFRQDPTIKAFGFNGFAENVHAIEKDGKLVSACVSTRENASCGEAWVYTDKKYRHQGLAQKVVSVWAASLLSVGKVPFYSHKIQNVASAYLAKRLGLQPLFEEIVISYVNV